MLAGLALPLANGFPMVNWITPACPELFTEDLHPLEKKSHLSLPGL